MKLPTYERFEEMCDAHDWHYFHSDDHSVYSKGREKAIELQLVVREGGKEYLDIMVKSMERQGV